MAPYKCHVLGCQTISNISIPSSTRMHRFPKELERCGEWVRLSGNVELLEIPSSNLQHRRVCALHFDEKMYFNKYKIILRVNAVPNTNLPDPLTAEVMSRFPVVMSSPVSLDENLGTSSQSRKRKRSATPATIETNSCKKAKPNAEECVDTSDFPVVTDDVPTFFVSSSEVTAAPKTPIKRTTKASLSRQVGLQRKDRTPRKEALLKLCQEKHLEAQQVRRRLTYAVKKAKALSSRFKSSGDVESSVLQEIKISSAARDLLNWEKRNFGKEIRSRRWLLKEKCFVLAIYKRSPKTYRYLRQHFTLPSERTLNNILQEIKLEPGVSPVFLKIFEKKTFNWVQKDKVGVLAFDEVSADAHLSYNHLMDRIDGYEDFGSRGRTHLKANHVLVFRVRLLNSEIDYPVAFYPVNGTCPKETLAILIEDVIKRMQDIDIKILASVSDQGPTNRGAITILRAKCPQGECDSVYNVGGSHIVHLWDFPHLLKSLRNNLLTSDLNYETGKIAQWRHIIEFFKLDEGICKLSKLKYAHLCPLGRNKMRVSLAAQIFSETNFKGMTTFHSLSAGKHLQDAMQTAELLLSVDRLFDAVNGPSRKDIPKPETRCRVTSESYHHTYWREMVKIMKKWFYTRKDTGEVHIPPCLSGFIDNLRGLGRIWNTIKKLGIEDLNLRDLNQDSLENYFGQIRATCGSTDNFSIPQFVAGMKTVLVQKISANIRGSNCSEADATNLKGFEELLGEVMKCAGGAEHTGQVLLRAYEEGSQPPSSLSKLTRQGPSYTCSTICTKILEATKGCEICKQDLTSSTASSDFTYQNLQENGPGMYHPSPQATNYFLQVQKYVVEHWKEFGWESGVMEKVKNNVSTISPLDWLKCPTHHEMVEKGLQNLVISRVLHLQCTAINNEDIKIRKTRQIGKSIEKQDLPAVLEEDYLNQTDWMLLTGLEGE
ncbi:Transposable element P transposase [Frankliniella fusca]|uniref:Transposable element P transposase n=1 Tax=Frankliniella fusca TaxID=407009 RepID=A0AAE1HW50_9NEOP|nr:Transposable element P transposase [Frankliniella fusca]